MKQTIDGAGGATYGGIALFQSTIGAPDFNFTLNAVDQATGTPLFVNNLNDGLWHHLSADLGAAGYAGFHISSIEAGIHNGTPTGTWDVYFANVALVRADGSVYQIFAGQDGASVANISGNTAAGSRLMTSGTERIDTANDPEIANTFYLADHLGTTQMEFSAGGAPVWRGEFAPFGEELDTQVTANHYKFTGKERDAESGLDYFGARYYASNMGRFMSPDWRDVISPVPYAQLDNPQTLNLYSYVQNNPLSRTDPNGHAPCTVDGEKHGSLWCFGHSLGLVETKVEQTRDARFYENQYWTERGIAPKDRPQLNNDQVLNAYKNGGFAKPDNDIEKMEAGIIGGVSIYRGGSSLLARAMDVKVDPATGLLKTTRGISLSTDADGLARFGGAREIESVPEGLEIKQVGQNANHFELTPKQPMSMESYQNLLNQVKFK